MERILVVDDNREITELIGELLTREGYEVTKAFSGIEALNLLTEEHFLVILDVMMPELDGCEVCREIRKKSNVPVLYLSAKGTDIDKVIGFSAGGDDYMVKPFSAIELVARVKALTRRYSFLRAALEEKDQKTDIRQAKRYIEVDTIGIDLDAHRITRLGEEVNLTRTEYEILVLLATNKGRVFSTEEIFKSVWKEKYYEGNNTVMVHLARLREKIEDNPRNAKIIKNVWGVGYRIEA